MKYLFFFITFLLTLTCNAQEVKLLVKQKLISNFSETKLYPKLTEEIDGKITWKKSFKYLDSIEIYAISYLSDNLKINGFLVKPKKEGKYPCIIFNRGGNREHGALKISDGAITMGQIAKEGYVVIASQYRGNGGSEGQEEFGGKDINDITILPKVLSEIPSADTTKIGIFGWSRGGMMTYIALTKMQNIKVIAVGGAVSDCFGSIIDRPELETDVFAELIPNYFDNKFEELNKRSAIKWVEKFPKNVPILLLHGGNDIKVKPKQSLDLAIEFEKLKIAYKLIIYNGGDHSLSQFKNEVKEEILNWFNIFLKK